MNGTDFGFVALGLLSIALELGGHGAIVWMGARRIRPWSPRAGRLVMIAGAMRPTTWLVTNVIGFTIGIQLGQPWGPTYRAVGFGVNGVITTGTSIAFWVLLVLAALEIARTTDAEQPGG